MPPVLLEKHRTVLERTGHFDASGDPEFAQNHDEDELTWHVLYLKHETWEDLGEPENLTITIVAGDLLNAGAK